MNLCFVFFVIAIIAIVVSFSIAQSKKADANWSEVAKRLGLRYTSEGKLGARLLRGKLDGYEVRVRTVKRKKGEGKATYTIFELHYSKTTFEYKLTRSKALSGVAAFFGAQDIEIGSEEFDRAVVVNSNRPMHIASYLTPNRQKAILNLFLAYPGAEVKNGQVEWEKRGLVTSAAELEGVLRRFVRLARVLEGHAEPVDLEQEAVRELTTVESPPREVSPGVPETLLGGGALTVETLLADQGNARAVEAHEEEAEPVTDDALGEVYDLPPIYEPPTAEATEDQGHHDAPADDDAPEFPARPAVPALDESGAESVLPDPPSTVVPPPDVEVAPEPTPTPRPPEPMPEPEPEAPVAPGASSLPTTSLSKSDALATDAGAQVRDLGKEVRFEGSFVLPGNAPAAPDAADAPGSDDTSLATADVCAALFARNQLGSRVETLFRERYQDAEVIWEGKLERLDRYFSDFVFRGGAGTKATITVYEIGKGYSARKVEAIVQLAPAAADQLRPRLGETIRFRGRLAKCEAFMRRFFVAEGEVL